MLPLSEYSGVEFYAMILNKLMVEMRKFALLKYFENIKLF